MATSIKLKGDIRKIEAAIKSKATPKSLVPKLEAQLSKIKSELASLSSAKPKKGVTKTKVLSSLQKLKAKIKSTKSLSGYKKSGIDIKKDADVPALPLGRRTAKTTGNTYYEYRLNRADVKQPPKRYPKLEKGGYMADGGKIKNQYEGKSPDYLWNNLTQKQREHFVHDHKLVATNDYRVKLSFDELPVFMKKEITEHYKMGQYADGGMMAKGGLTEHGLQKGDKIITKMGNVIKVENDGKEYVVNLDKGERISMKKWMSMEAKDTYAFAYMESGGRTLSAINRDRAYKSNQPWEQDYQRKSRPKNPKYKSSNDCF